MAIFIPATDKKGREISYNSKEVMKKVLVYINKLEKTKPELRGGTYLLNPDRAYEEFMLTKQAWGKTDKRMCIHFIQSFRPDELSKEDAGTAFQIAEEMMQHQKFQGFQISYATHLDRDHIHNHFIINTVNFETGYKWQCSKEDLEELKGYSDQLCKKYGLSVIDRSRIHRGKSETEKQAEQKGISWKREIQLAVDQALRVAASQSEFIQLMNRQGYRVKWNPKYVTFIASEHKAVRNWRFEPPEAYTKERFQECFKENARRFQRTPEEVKEEASAYRREAFFAVQDAAAIATSQEEFIQILEQQQYHVRWDDTHEYITFQKPGHQAVRNRNFYPKEAYTKEALLEKFESNKETLKKIEKGTYVSDSIEEVKRSDMLYYLLRFFGSPKQGDYPHQTRERGDSIEYLKERQKEREKGKGVDWEI